LRHLGTLGYGALVDGGCALAEYFMEQVSCRSSLESTGALDTNLVCFRGRREGATDAENDAWNRRLQRHLLAEAGTFFSLPAYRGKRWLRAVLLNPFTEHCHIDKAFACLDRFVASA
jgi:glutamate/tyrosine decarboxylase-like PLP-dependent enzyme